MGAALEALDPKLLELPIIVLGVAWTLLGAGRLSDTGQVKKRPIVT